MQGKKKHRSYGLYHMDTVTGYVSRLGLAVRDECGVEAVELLDQCGPGQVRLAPSTQHMEHIMQVRDYPQSFV